MMEENLRFAHLHVHTEYSLLDGLSRINELVDKAKEFGMDSIAITDHGVMYGVIDFYKKATAEGIKPVLGCEVYVAAGSRFDKENSRDNFYYHLVLLAENNEGYSNLIKLVSYGFTEGFYYKPRVDIELLKKYHKGIIALSACLAGPVARTVLRTSYDEAKKTALLYNDIFGDGNFYLELQDHGISEQQEVNQALLRMNAETGIPLVCTNDVHYVNKDDYEAHDILLCIQTAKTVNDEDRMRYEGNQFYLKSPEEMYSLFPYAKQALENTAKIADRCNVSIEFNNYKLPVFDVPNNIPAFDYLKMLAQEGLKERYGERADEMQQRLDYELGTIESMGFVDYFLIVWDFIKFARDNNIMVGPGRGSAAGSITAYCLRITDIDPIKYSLIFERFLNPARVSMPDIDVDFCYERRQEVIDYVISKYGADHVSQIITFGTMAARNAIRDVGRALGMSYNEVDKIAKLIPMELKITIKKALNQNTVLLNEYENNDRIKYLIDMSMKLEGLVRHASTHAAGVVICDKPVMDYVPLNSNDGVITTQFTMTTIEELGLLKMDFLGLRTLTVIQNSFQEINRIHSLNLSADNLDYDDPKVFKTITAGDTMGIFQLESSGMRQFMKELAPHNLEDVIAGISLYRPGPMDFIPKYISGKKNHETVTYTHPALKPILEPTYGCIVYQEQVMQIVQKLAGYSLGRSDLLRRAMSKKKADVMLKERKNFIYGIPGDIPGCVGNGISEAAAGKIFDEMIDFAKYAFNKSHAAAYAVVAYQTAWLKIYYPVEFMAALLTSVTDNTDKVTEYAETCRSLGIELLKPDVNDGFPNFSVSGEKIRFGLAAIKNVGKTPARAIVTVREKTGLFKSLTHFIDKMDSRVNSKCLESLIKAGAFDSFGGKRAQYLQVFKQIYSGRAQAKKNNIAGQISLFEASNGNASDLYKDALPDVNEIPQSDLLAMEKEYLGIYVSGHPLSPYAKVLKLKTDTSTLDFLSGERLKIYDRQPVKIGGIINAVTVKYTKNNKIMAFVSIEDLYGSIELILFSDVYTKYSDLLVQNSVILAIGKASVSEDTESKIIVDDIIPYSELEIQYNEFQKRKTENAARVKKVLWLRISESDNDAVEAKKEQIKSIIAESHSGDVKVRIFYESNKNKMEFPRFISVDKNMLSMLKKLLGDSSVVLNDIKV